MSLVNEKELRALAKLSLLPIKDEEVSAFLPAIISIFEYMQELNHVPLRGIQDIKKSINVMREDKIKITDSTPLLAQAPQTDGTSFVVPKILD